MQTTVKIDSAAFEKQIIAAAVSLGKALPDVYRDEIGRLGANLIEVRTPPKNRSQGLKVVRGQIMNTTTAVHEKLLDTLEKRYGSGPAQGVYWSLRQTKMPFAYQKIIRNQTELHRWHSAQRSGTTGRTKYRPTTGLVTPTKAYVPKGLFERYVRFQQKGLGMAKGGWWRAFSTVYTKRPPAAWITKKAGQGTGIVNLQPGTKQEFTAINRSPWANRTAEATRAVKDALTQREKTIPVAVEKELKRQFSKKGFSATGTNILPGIVSS